MYSLCVCDACCVTYHVTKIFQAFSILNSAHGSKVTYIKIIAGLHILRREGERRPGIEARKNHLFIFLFMKLSDEVEACECVLPYA